MSLENPFVLHGWFHLVAGSPKNFQKALLRACEVFFDQTWLFSAVVEESLVTSGPKQLAADDLTLG